MASVFARPILTGNFTRVISMIQSTRSWSQTLLLSTLITAFARYQRVASGPLPVVALAVKQVSERGATAPILIYDDVTGRAIDIDTRGSDEEVVARLSGSLVSKLLPRSSNRGRAAMPPFSPPVSEEPRAGQPRGPGRPKLGVVAREVTLLPRHWEWLNKQPGGASVALRKAGRRSAPHAPRQRSPPPGAGSRLLLHVFHRR